MTIALGAELLLSPVAVALQPVTSPDFDGDGTVGFGEFVLFAGASGSSAEG